MANNKQIFILRTTSIRILPVKPAMIYNYYSVRTMIFLNCPINCFTSHTAIHITEITTKLPTEKVRTNKNNCLGIKYSIHAIFCDKLH